VLKEGHEDIDGMFSFAPVEARLRAALSAEKYDRVARRSQELGPAGVASQVASRIDGLLDAE
jgi:hypothetical protein